MCENLSSVKKVTHNRKNIRNKKLQYKFLIIHTNRTSRYVHNYTHPVSDNIYLFTPLVTGNIAPAYGNVSGTLKACPISISLIVG